MSAMHFVKFTVRMGVKICSIQNNNSLKRTPDESDRGIHIHVNVYKRSL